MKEFLLAHVRATVEWAKHLSQPVTFVHCIFMGNRRLIPAPGP